MGALTTLRVRDLMNPEVATIGHNERASLADEIMQLGRIRHLPVLDDDGRMVGILSRRDMFRGAMASVLGYGEHAQRRTLEMLRVKELMTPAPHTISPDAPLSEAAARMVKLKVGCLPVVDGEALVGILTEGSFVELVASEAG